MKFIIIGVAAILAVVVCALFRVNLWSLTPWSFRPPSRLDDDIEPIKNLDARDQK